MKQLPMTKKSINDGKTYAAISYFTLIGTLIAFYMNREKPNPFTSFHIRQALGLGLLFVIIGYNISLFNSLKLTYVFWAVFLVLYLYCLLAVILGKVNNMPLLGNIFQKLFSSIGT